MGSDPALAALLLGNETWKVKRAEDRVQQIKKAAQMVKSKTSGSANQALAKAMGVPSPATALGGLDTFEKLMPISSPKYSSIMDGLTAQLKTAKEKEYSQATPASAYRTAPGIQGINVNTPYSQFPTLKFGARAGDVIDWKGSGKYLDRAAARALKQVEKKLGYPIDLTQGAFNPGGVSASGGTHDEGGAIDIPADDWQNKVAALRAAGFAAWYRDPSEGPWPAHIHAIFSGSKNIAPLARTQLLSYLRNDNGLAGSAVDTFPYDPPLKYFNG